MRATWTIIAASACVCLLAGGAAAQGLPEPSNSIIGNGTSHERINLSAFLGGTAADSLSPGTTLQVLVRDLANNPVPNVLVALDFTGAYTDVRISSVQAFHGESVSASPGGPKRIENTTGADGRVVFAVTGGGAPDGAPHGPQQVRVYANGVMLGTIGAGSYDRDGVGGQDPADLSAFATDYFSGMHPERSDFDGNGTVGFHDLALFAQYYFGGRLTSATGSLVAP